MKVYISADMEGITGVTHWDEVDHDKPSVYTQFQARMTQEVVAACKGAADAGAKEIWVKDAHYSGRNILSEKLPETFLKDYYIGVCISCQPHVTHLSTFILFGNFNRFPFVFD